MPPQSRGNRARLGSHSISTPNLPTLNGLTPIDTNLAAAQATSTAPIRGQYAFTHTDNEAFPDLDEDGHEEKLEEIVNDIKAPRPISPNVQYPPTFNGEEEDEDSQSEDEEDDDSEQEGRSPSDVASSSGSTSGQSTSSGSEASSEHARTSSASPTRSTATISAPSTLRAPPSAARIPSPSSSINSSPQKPPPRPAAPNRTQSLYTQPPSQSKSYSALSNLHTSPSRTHLNPAAFAPPFYNRPPTPLPPSPSLTSLLRPLPFSTLPSRPATPTRTPVDSSSDTDAHPAPTAAVSTAGHSTTSLPPLQPTAPPVAPKIPTYEYYGFTLYVTSSLTFLFYLLWSFLPTPFLHLLGIYYYPNRWWALAVPAWLVILLVWIYVALAAYNTGTLTLGVSDLGCMVDEKGRVAALGGDGEVDLGRRRPDDRKRTQARKARDQSRGKSKKGKRGKRSRNTSKEDRARGRRGDEELDWRNLWNVGTDAVLDVPIGGVCEVLYGQGRERSDDDDDHDGIQMNGTTGKDWDKKQWYGEDKVASVDSGTSQDVLDHG